MRELDLMLSGALYDPSDPELASMKKRARSLQRAYNASTEDEPAHRDALLRQLFGRLGASGDAALR